VKSDVILTADSNRTDSIARICEFGGEAGDSLKTIPARSRVKCVSQNFPQACRKHVRHAGIAFKDSGWRLFKNDSGALPSKMRESKFSAGVPETCHTRRNRF
jgi:predicted nucleic acid-binding Zn ribbon protein